jgi:hypothetical protein
VKHGDKKSWKEVLMTEQTELTFALGWDEPESIIADFIHHVGKGALAIS